MGCRKSTLKRPGYDDYSSYTRILKDLPGININDQQQNPGATDFEMKPTPKDKDDVSPIDKDAEQDVTVSRREFQQPNLNDKDDVSPIDKDAEKDVTVSRREFQQPNLNVRDDVSPIDKDAEKITALMEKIEGLEKQLKEKKETDDKSEYERAKREIKEEAAKKEDETVSRMKFQQSTPKDKDDVSPIDKDAEKDETVYRMKFQQSTPKDKDDVSPIDKDAEKDDSSFKARDREDEENEVAVDEAVQDILDYIKQGGRDPKNVKRLLDLMRPFVYKNFCDKAEFWVGYEPNNKDVPVFVAEVKQKICKAPEWYKGCRLVQRVEDEEVASSTEETDNHERIGNPKFSKQEITKLRKFMARNTDRLLESHSNILAIMASDKIIHEKEKTIEEKTCVVIYVRTKAYIPFYEEEFELDDNEFPLDVREGRNSMLVSSLLPKEYSKSVRMGCKIGSAYGSGTLTGFVELRNGKIGCLTAWHLFDTGEGEHTVELLTDKKFNKNVYQPELSEEHNNKIGRVIDVSEKFDAALIEIDQLERLPRNGNFPSAVCTKNAFPFSKPTKFDTGNIISCKKELDSKSSCLVVKYGAATKTTFGNIGLPATHHRLNLLNRRWYNLLKPICVHPPKGTAFGAKGDSGSLVFLEDDDNGDDDEKGRTMGEDDDNDYTMKEYDEKDDKKKALRAMGMLVSKTDTTTGSSAVVMPIWKILKSFDLPLHLLSFEEPWNIRLDQLQAQMEEVNANLSTVGQQLAQIADITKKTDEALTKLIQ